MARASTLIALLLAGCSQLPECKGVGRDELTQQYLTEVALLAASGACDEFNDPNECPQYQQLKARHHRR